MYVYFLSYAFIKDSPQVQVKKFGDASGLLVMHEYGLLFANLVDMY